MKTSSDYTSALRILMITIATALLLGGCAYKINVQQGNYLDPDRIDQIEAGMTRQQVQFLLGSPAIEDVFHNDRWDYVYQVQYGKTRRIIRRKVTIHFDGDQVTSVEQFGFEPESTS